MLALVPHLAAWGLTQINGALAAAGTVVAALSAGADGRARRQDANEGVLYDGLHVLGGGSILGGLILGAIAVFIIDRDFMKAVGLRARRRGADVLRLHARRADRHRPDADGGRQLPRDRRHLHWRAAEFALAAAERRRTRAPSHSRESRGPGLA